MKIFFTGSPRALRTHPKEHMAIYKAIEKYGGENLSQLVINANPKEFYEANNDQVLEHFKVTMNHVKNADAVIAEVTTHSMSMGYIVNKTLELNKPAIVLHLPGFKPFFFGGIENEKLLVCEYTPETIDEVIKNAFKFIDTKSDVRFNFYLPSNQIEFLDTIGKDKKLTRSAVLRQIISEKMNQSRIQ